MNIHSPEPVRGGVAGESTRNSSGTPQPAFERQPAAAATLVRKMESLAALSDAERWAIESLPMRICAVEARHDIARSGDKPTQCCLVLDGWTYRYRLLSNNRRQILSFHITGDVPDLQGLHLRTHDHGLATATKAIVALIPHESLRALSTRFPAIATAFWRDALIDAAASRERLTAIRRGAGIKRSAHLICELYLRLQAVEQAASFRCALPLRYADLADALGLTTVHINRVLKEMRGKGLITLHRRMLEIHDWDELARIAEFDPAYLHLSEVTDQ